VRRSDLASGPIGIQSAVLLEGENASVEIPAFDRTLPFSALYEGISFVSDQARAP
jgi:hypothetical protein